MATTSSLFIFCCLFAFAASIAFATDPNQLQDFCVADLQSTIKVNGLPCKPAPAVTAADFFFTGLNKAGNTTNAVGSAVTQVSATQLAGLNTLGISMVRIDYAPLGQNPPHIHPRGTEILVVLEGTLFVGFVSSNGDGNRFFNKTLNVGDVFVFPQGLIHFQVNPNAYKPAVAIGALSSQNAGVVTVAKSVFGSVPKISDTILAKAFNTDTATIDKIQAKF